MKYNPSADEAYVQKNREGKSATELAAIDQARQDALNKHKAWVEKRKADSRCSNGKHSWIEQSQNKGLWRYKCTNCTATKQVDSGD